MRELTEGELDNIRTEVRKYILEGDLRREVATLEESAAFGGRSAERYSLSITLAPPTEEDELSTEEGG